MFVAAEPSITLGPALNLPALKKCLKVEID
jgi:hypothetical protein